MAVFTQQALPTVMWALLALQINIYYQHNNFAYVFINTRTIEHYICPILLLHYRRD